MSSQTLAGPPGACCIKGVKHEGTPVGETIEIAGVPTYLSEPPAGTTAHVKKILLFLSDIGGVLSKNNQLVQDCYAENGYVVLGIDYLFGDYVHLHMQDPTFDLLKWATGKRDGLREKQIVPKWLAAVKDTYGKEAQYFCVGYCFGGPFVLDLAASDEIVAAAFAHPAFLEEDHFRKVTKPLLMSCAEEDFTFPAASRRRAEDILVEKKALYHIQVFSGVSHGFATRGDLEKENERWAKEESIRGIIGWFDRFSV